MSNIETLLHVEIADEFDALAQMKKGADDYKATVEGVSKLMDKAIEIEKLEADRIEKEEARAEERKDRKIRNILTAAGIVIPAALTIWGTKASFKFEETGTVTTIMGRGFIQKLLPKK